MSDMIRTIEYRGDTVHAAEGKPWCLISRCPDGCSCDVSTQQLVLYGFRTAFEADDFRARMAADIAAGKHLS